VAWVLPEVIAQEGSKSDEGGISWSLLGLNEIGEGSFQGSSNRGRRAKEILLPGIFAEKRFKKNLWAQAPLWRGDYLR